MKNYILRLTLTEDISGNWDGGTKRVFDFSLEGIPKKDKKGYFVRVGSWEANYWCNVAISKTIKKTLSNARRRFGTYPGGKWEYIECEENWYSGEFKKLSYSLG
jgi:hypothetical protein